MLAILLLQIKAGLSLLLLFNLLLVDGLAEDFFLSLLFDLSHADLLLVAKQCLLHTILHGLFVELPHVLDNSVITLHGIRVQLSSLEHHFICFILTETADFARSVIGSSDRLRGIGLSLRSSLLSLDLPGLLDFVGQPLLPIDERLSTIEWEYSLVTTLQISVQLRLYLALLALHSDISRVDFIQVSPLLIEQVAFLLLGHL